jgi:hypothetical protein
MGIYPVRQQASIDFNSIYLMQIEVMLLVAVVAWSLIGLLVWLECYGEQKPQKHFTAFFVTLICGPCAWIISAWTLAHRRRVVIPRKVVVSDTWCMPGRN